MNRDAFWEALELATGVPVLLGPLFLLALPGAALVLLLVAPLLVLAVLLGLLAVPVLAVRHMRAR
jgi:hypothetical protein